MIDPTFFPLVALLGVACRVHVLARRGRRAELLLRTLEREGEDHPDVDALEVPGASRFEPTSLHVNVGAGSLIAVDVRRAAVHLASLRGQRIESASLPIAQIESVQALENDAPLVTGRTPALVRSFRLRIALPDERRSLYDVELLERPCRRGSVPHLAAWSTAVSCGVALAGHELGKRTPDGRGRDVHASDADAPARETIDPAGTDPAAGRGVDPSAHVWSRRSKVLHGTLAASLFAVAIAPRLAAIGSATDDGAALAVADAESPAEPVAATPLTPEGRARAFESALDEHERGARTLLGSTHDDGAPSPLRADLDRAVAAFDEALSLPLADAHARRVERLRTALAERRARELPRYRESFARNARRGAWRVAAWTRGEEHGVLELTRHDFADPAARRTLWDALADDVRKLGFERVEFRAFRNGEPLESVALAGPPDDSGAPDTSTAFSVPDTDERLGFDAPSLAGAR